MLELGIRLDRDVIVVVAFACRCDLLLLLFVIAEPCDYLILQLDVHNAFLNGNLTETIYMRQPLGYINAQFSNHICLLKRSLYGLKQAPRAWFNRLHTFLLSIGFKASKTDLSLFHYSQDSASVYLLVYVDDILVMGSDKSLKMYMTDILKRAGMAECKPLATPIPVSKSVPSNADLYDDSMQYKSLAGALQKSVSRELHAFSDSDWAGCPEDRKSTSGYAVCLGSNLVSWVCKKQRTVVRSFAEAEYKALADVCAEVICILSLLH
ncbi:PREDICTED: uncharacterized protein LOC109147319 [Ipomoea nil]|uniref:uncharacterized protein LOC109147319 n=1 Tax=Ipomoea nil TaxID=35883 RepID=UPI000901F46B|nr:PREDICTED: uncharacterized protein LOC109147319 [Ipomoea nil]